MLEIAVGPGHSFLEILKRVDAENTVCGVVDARQLPFPNETFDVLYNSHMLDLIPLDDMPVVLTEFHRVLDPHGRLVLVNLSKKTRDNRTWAERFYQLLPQRWVPYLMGGCRPVLMEQPVKNAGFVDVIRAFIRHVIPSEIVVAKKRHGDG